MESIKNGEMKSLKLEKERLGVGGGVGIRNGWKRKLGGGGGGD